MPPVEGPNTLNVDTGEQHAVRKGSRMLKDGRLSADYVRALRPSIRHVSPLLLLKDALKEGK